MSTIDCIRCAGSGIVPQRDGAVAAECPDCRGSGRADPSLHLPPATEGRPEAIVAVPRGLLVEFLGHASYPGSPGSEGAGRFWTLHAKLKRLAGLTPDEDPGTPLTVEETVAFIRSEFGGPILRQPFLEDPGGWLDYVRSANEPPISDAVAATAIAIIQREWADGQ